MIGSRLCAHGRCWFKEPSPVQSAASNSLASQRHIAILLGFGTKPLTHVDQKDAGADTQDRASVLGLSVRELASCDKQQVPSHADHLPVSDVKPHM